MVQVSRGEASTEGPAAVARRTVASLRRPGELFVLAVLLLCYWLVYLSAATDFQRLMNVAGPVTLCAILAWTSYRMVERNPIAVWAPLFWFRVSCSVYYGFGALVPHIVNEEALAHIYSLHYFDDALNLKINLVYCFGIFCTLLLSHFFLGFRRKKKRSESVATEHRGDDRTLLFAVAFLLVGGGLRYGVALPNSFGLTDFTLPGAVVTLSNMYYVGIYLLIVHAIGNDRRVLPVVFFLVAVEVLISIASFAKTELLLILIFSFLGFISRDVTRKKVLLGTSCVLLAYFAFQPLVHFGRAELALRYGEIRGAGLTERLDIVQNYFDDGNNRAAVGAQKGLTRLSYVNVTAFAIDRYDAGASRNTLGRAAAVLVPRFLWPDKPIITNLGPDLYFQIRRREGTALGLGHFAEAYWNFGWAGIFLFMLALALILSLFTRVSMGIVARKDWLFLPVVFIGVNMGLRVDGHFVPDILGPAWMAVCLGLVILMVKRIGKGSTRRSTSFTGSRA